MGEGGAAAGPQRPPQGSDVLFRRGRFPQAEGEGQGAMEGVDACAFSRSPPHRPPSPLFCSISTTHSPPPLPLSAQPPLPAPLSAGPDCDRTEEQTQRLHPWLEQRTARTQRRSRPGPEASTPPPSTPSKERHLKAESRHTARILPPSQPRCSGGLKRSRRPRKTESERPVSHRHGAGKSHDCPPAPPPGPGPGPGPIFRVIAGGAATP